MKKNLSIIVALLLGFNITMAWAQKNQLPNSPGKETLENAAKPIGKTLSEHQSNKKFKTEKGGQNNRPGRGSTLPLAILHIEYEEFGGIDTVSLNLLKYKTGSELVEESISQTYNSNGLHENNTKIINTYTQSDEINLTEIMLWNAIKLQWEPYLKYEYLIGSKGEDEGIISYAWNIPSGSWAIDFGFKSEHTYNGSGKIEFITYSSYEGAWELKSKEERLYNGNGFWASSIYYSFDNNNWELNWMEEYTLNTSGEWTEILGKEWNNSTMAWADEYKIIGLNWHNFEKLIFADYTLQYYTTPGWENFFRVTATYNSNNNLLSELFLSWNGLNWEPLEQELNTYDSFYNLTEQLYQEFNGTNWETLWGEQISYIYDADGKIEFIEHFTLYNNNWEKYWKEVYLYTLPEPVIIQKLTYGNTGFSLAPNPAKENIKVRFNSDTAGIITVYNISGKVVIKENIPSSASQVVIDLTHLEAGIYFIQFNNGASANTKKFIKTTSF
ncbi:MAG: T9SS type A sorting domain-containing protein [Bacteroidetes bacterium]|nr:T9SS type A sorting domain-containing protein [Bacteroidota bacterium]